MTDSFFSIYADTYCLIQAGNLFISTCLADEVRILGGQQTHITQILQQCADFGLSFSAHQSFFHLSGGEQVVVCSLILGYLLPKKGPDLLFIHTLEALSSKNRDRLLILLKTMLPNRSLYILEENGPKPL